MKIIAYIIISNAINFLIIIKNFNINNKQLFCIYYFIIYSMMFYILNI